MAKKPDPKAFENPFNAFVQAQADAVGRVAAFNTAVAESLGRYGQEFVSFVQERLAEDAKTQQELLACRDLNKLADIQNRFLQRAMQQYIDETGRLVDLGREVFEQALKQAKS